MKNRLRNAQAVRSLWRGWTVAMGAPTLLMLMSLFVSPVWLPIAAFALELVLFVIIRDNRVAELPKCMLTLFVMTRILFWSGLIMLVLYLLCKHGLWPYNSPHINPNLPYIPTLVLGPVSAVIAGWTTVRKSNFGFCVDCRLRNGTSAERGFLGRMFTREGQYQVAFICYLGLVLTVVGYLYYWLIYVNVNLNSPDKFCFVWLPLIFYVVSLVYMAMRYFTLWSYYDQELASNNVRRPDTTQIRYIILESERLYLAEPDRNMSLLTRGLDTPATVTLSRRDNISLHEARGYFANMEPASDFEIRFMYESIDAGGDSNVFHYIVNVSEPEPFYEKGMRGRWYTLPEVERLLNNGMLAPMMAAEIHRLYTITMAWKTYDRTGRRLYKTKNYRPTFRLRNIQQWDVNFNDPHWLRVSVNNQDRPFYSLKRFWRRYINGVRE